MYLPPVVYLLILLYIVFIVGWLTHTVFTYFFPLLPAQHRGCPPPVQLNQQTVCRISWASALRQGSLTQPSHAYEYDCNEDCNSDCDCDCDCEIRTFRVDWQRGREDKSNQPTVNPGCFTGGAGWAPRTAVCCAINIYISYTAIKGVPSLSRPAKKEGHIFTRARARFLYSSQRIIHRSASTVPLVAD